MGCGYAVCAMVGALGIILLFAANAQWRSAERSDPYVLGGMGLFLTGASIAVIGPMRRSVARAQERREREEARPDEPWTWEPTWLDPKGIPQSRRRNSGVFLIGGLMATALSLPVVFAIPSEMARGNHGVLAGLLFTAVGLGLLSVALVDALRRRKYGLARFVPAGVPIPLHTEVAGMVLVDRVIVPAGPGRISLDCVRTTLVRNGNKRTQRDEVIAHMEREIVPADWTTTIGESRLFVQVPISGGVATTMGPLDPDHPTHEWRLGVSVPTVGADFVAEFVLPIFEGAGIASATADATASRRAHRPDVFRAAGIQEEAQAGAIRGTALAFPKGQGRAVAAAPLVMTLGFSALA